MTVNRVDKKKIDHFQTHKKKTEITRKLEKKRDTKIENVRGTSNVYK